MSEKSVVAGALVCGCVSWSKDRPDLIRAFCERHLAENERKQEVMRGIAKTRNAASASRSFTPANIEANLKRMEL